MYKYYTSFYSFRTSPTQRSPLSFLFNTKCCVSDILILIICFNSLVIKIIWSINWGTVTEFKEL